AELEAKGLTVGALEADGLTLPVTTTVAGAGKAFSTEFDGYRLTDGTTGLVNTAAPALDGRVADEVRTVVRLSTLGAYKPLHTGAKGKPRKKSAETADTAQTGPQPRLTGTTPAMCGDVSTLFATAVGNIPAQYDTKDNWTPRSLAAQYNMAN
ncbi:hypothetical protein XF35_40565, partial [Streptomyces platensis subsp. clarensis]|nr:hypothetical protein [Streptomyces platensis subsp. clarensis]